MLDKEAIRQIIANLDFPPNQFWVTAGAALVLHGVKAHTKDVDIGCTRSLFARLIEQGHPVRILADGSRSIELENAEVFEEWRVDQVIDLDSIPVASLEDVKRQKRELGRPKDIEDIALIERYQG
jgi:hypothetical protein